MKLIGLVVAAAALVAAWQLVLADDEARGARVLRYEVTSKATKRTLRQVAVRPARAAEKPPLLVFLPGRGGGGEESNANAKFFAALDRLGSKAPAVVFPSGGDSSYFHPRRSGDWSRYVLDEVIPRAVRELGANPDRVAIGGISMGGFGAYAVARRRPSRFCAVGGHSAALWRTGAETPAGAFDDAADFARYGDLIGLARARSRAPWGRARLYLDGGTRDPFRAAGDAFAAALGIPMRHGEGGHDRGYWFPRYRRYLAFYADALARC